MVAVQSLTRSYLAPSFFIDYNYTNKILISNMIFIFLYVYNIDIQIGIKKEM